MPSGCPIGPTKSLTVDGIQRAQMNFSLALEYYLGNSKGFDFGLFFPLKSYTPNFVITCQRHNESYPEFTLRYIIVIKSWKEDYETDSLFKTELFIP